MFLLVVFTGVAVSASTMPLRQRVVSSSGLTGDAIIIGRAQCGESTWLLTNEPALVEIKVAERSIVSRKVRGLAGSERPWGLACVGATELWTLADYRTLARLSQWAEVTSRTKLRQPRLNVFGVGDTLLLQQPPGNAGGALLAAVRGAEINRAQPWPGLTMGKASLTIDVPSALVACGLPYEASLPCWITNQTRITVSDGTRDGTLSVQPQFVTSTAVDPNVPLWDVAAARASALWILTSAAPGEEGRRMGARLTRSNLRGDDLGAVQLRPRARVIISADEHRAVLLTMAGTLVEVIAP